MGVLDRFRSDPEDDGDETPDFYRVVKKTPKGGWKAVDGFDELEEPVDKDTFEYNASPLEPGEYRLFSVVGNLNRQPTSGVGWTLEVDGDRRDDQQDDQISELKREIRALRDDDSTEEPADPKEAVERQKANLQLAALQSEDFLKRYGDQIILSMFDGDGSGGKSESAIGYDDWQENPIGASLFETMNMVREEPEQIERLGEAIGRGVGTFVGSAADGYADGDASLEDVKAARDEATDADADAGDATADEEPTRDLDAGPASIDDLGAETQPADTEALAADIADARTTARRAGPGEQDRPEDAPAATADADTDTDTTTTDATADTAPPEPDAAPDHTDAASPDPDPMTADPNTDTTDTTDRSSDNAAAEIAGDL